MPTSFKLVGIGLLLSFISLIMVYRDMRLRLWGKTTEATVLNVFESRGRRGRVTMCMAFLFTDDKGNRVEEGCDLAAGFAPEAGGKVGILYLPGKPEIHRLAGEGSWFFYLLLLAGLGLSALGAWFFTRESVTEAHSQTNDDLEKWKQPPKPSDIARKIIRRF